MRRRTPSEIKADGDGYAEAYKEFCHLLKNHDVNKAMRKMKIFADAVALTVETATDKPQTAECPFDDPIPCEWVNCPNSTDCPYKQKTEPQTCEECDHWNDTEDGCADRHGCKTEPQTERSE